MNTKLILILSSEMLELAHNQFANHGCNDLNEKIIKMIPNEMLEEMRQWNSNGTDPWPDNASQVGDSSLMSFLSHKLNELAPVYERSEKLSELVDVEEKEREQNFYVLYSAGYADWNLVGKFTTPEALLKEVGSYCGEEFTSLDDVDWDGFEMKYEII